MARIPVDIIEAGHDLANQLLKEAHRNAKTVDEFRTGIFVMQIAALYILGTCAFNALVEEGNNPEEMAEGFKREIARIAKECKEKYDRGEVSTMSIEKDNEPRGNVQ